MVNQSQAEEFNSEYTVNIQWQNIIHTDNIKYDKTQCMQTYIVPSFLNRRNSKSTVFLENNFKVILLQ